MRACTEASPCPRSPPPRPPASAPSSPCNGRVPTLRFPRSWEPHGDCFHTRYTVLLPRLSSSMETHSYPAIIAYLAPSRPLHHDARPSSMESAPAIALASAIPLRARMERGSPCRAPAASPSPTPHAWCLYGPTPTALWWPLYPRHRCRAFSGAVGSPRWLGKESTICARPLLLGLDAPQQSSERRLLGRGRWEERAHPSRIGISLARPMAAPHFSRGACGSRRRWRPLPSQEERRRQPLGLGVWCHRRPRPRHRCRACALLLLGNTMENDVVETPMLENIRILVLKNCGVTWELLYPIVVSLSVWSFCC
jgi:hypothetical protein